jgi:hypothetical protein
VGKDMNWWKGKGSKRKLWIRKRKWQNRNVDNIKRLLRKKDTQQIVKWYKDDDPSKETEGWSGSSKGKRIF